MNMENTKKEIDRKNIVSIRFADKELNDIAEQAQIAGISRSAFVRKRALGHKIIASSDLNILKELRRIGGLIKHLYSQGNKSADMAAAWNMLQSTFNTISENFNKKDNAYDYQENP